jgi:hypothetical protein
MAKPTPKQLETYNFIKAYLAKYQYFPTYREMAEHSEVTIKVAFDRVNSLMKQGYLKKNGKRLSL